MFLLTQRPDEAPSDTESIASSRFKSAVKLSPKNQIVPQPNNVDEECEQLIKAAEKYINYKPAPADMEETFDEFEERIEGNIYDARKTLRDGHRETGLLETELRSLQYRVFNENQTTMR